MSGRSFDDTERGSWLVPAVTTASAEPVEPPVDVSLAYVPSRRATAGDEDVTLELRTTEDGELAMLVFSSLDLLVAGCGEAQPWVAIPWERVEIVMHLSGAEAVLWDVVLSDEQRYEEHKGSR